jgi:hypothetical protein
MTQRATAKLACRCMALWFFAQAAIHSVPMLIFLTSAAFMEGRATDQLLRSLLSAAIPVVQLILGVILWRKSDRIAQRMVRDEDADAPVTPLDVRSATSVAAVAVGLFLAIPAIQSLVVIAYVATRQDVDYGPSRFNSEALLGSAIQLVFSLFLILGSRGIANLVHRVRTYRGPEIDDTSSSDKASAKPTQD